MMLHSHYEYDVDVGLMNAGHAGHLSLQATRTRLSFHRPQSSKRSFQEGEFKIRCVQEGKVQDKICAGRTSPRQS